MRTVKDRSPNPTLKTRLAPGFFALLSLLTFVVIVGLGCAKDSIRSVVNVHRVESSAVKPGNRIAIVPFTGDTGRALGDLLSIELLRRQVDVVDRDSLDRIVAEIRRTESGVFDNSLSEKELFSQIGKIVGADYVLVGETSAYEPRIGPSAGRKAPVTTLGKSRLTMRLFTAVNGEVIWWGTAETFVTTPKGQHIQILDYLRMTARLSAMALMDPSMNEDVKEAEDLQIAEEFKAKKIKKQEIVKAHSSMDLSQSIGETQVERDGAYAIISTTSAPMYQGYQSKAEEFAQREQYNALMNILIEPPYSTPSDKLEGVLQSILENGEETDSYMDNDGNWFLKVRYKVGKGRKRRR